MRDQVPSALSRTHVAIVKSPVTELTMPAGRLAFPPLSASALPLVPGAKLAAPFKAALLPSPELSAATTPDGSLNLYQASAPPTPPICTLAVADISPLVARTTAAPPPIAGAVYKPLALMLPTPLCSDQAMVGCAATTPNWS